MRSLVFLICELEMKWGDTTSRTGIGQIKYYTKGKWPEAFFGWCVAFYCPGNSFFAATKAFATGHFCGRTGIGASSAGGGRIDFHGTKSDEVDTGDYGNAIFEIIG